MTANDAWLRARQALLKDAAELGPMARASLRRPDDFMRLSEEERWAIDKRLGVLDWDGSPEK